MLTDISPEFRLENLPTRSDIAKAELEKMKDAHTLNPLPAYGVNGDIIMPANYDKALRGATVALSFTLKHYAITSRTSDAAAQDTYVADIVKVRVLVPPAPRALEQSTRKRLVKKDDNSFAPKRKVVRTT